MDPELIIIASIFGLLLLFGGLYLWRIRRLSRWYSDSNLQKFIAQNEQLNQLFDEMPDLIYIKDLEGRFIKANKYTAKTFGLNDPSQLIGKTNFDYFDKELAQQFYNDEQEIIQGKTQIIGKEEVMRFPDGNEIHISTSKIPLKDHHGKISGIIGIGRNISEQKKVETSLRKIASELEEKNKLLESRREVILDLATELKNNAESLEKANRELARLSMVASQTDNVVLILDGDANLEWVNKGFERKYGLKLREYTDKYGSNLKDISSNPDIRNILKEVYSTKKTYIYSSSTVDKNNNRIWFQSNLTPILDGNNEIVNLILIDSEITSLKKAETEIKEKNTEIEAQAKELATINATKDRIFSIIAHDLKNPFQSIMGFVELLLDSPDELSGEKINEYLGIINESTHSVYYLLENLLNWAKSQTGQFTLKPKSINIKTLVEEIISQISLSASGKAIKLINSVDPEITINTDQNILSTVIRNIATNAIKYSYRGEEVVFAADYSNDYININITDKGVGISEENMDKLFRLESFFSSAGTNGETGTGLGLLICHEFVQKINGSIEVESEPGKGSTFSIKLPVNN